MTDAFIGGFQGLTASFVQFGIFEYSNDSNRRCIALARNKEGF